MSDMTKVLRIAGIVKYTAVDGHGLRMSIYTQGCVHNCKGCHNKHTQDPKGGFDKTISELIEEIKSTPYISGVTLSGGDPLYQYDAILELCKAIKSETDLNIIVYTGDTYDTVVRDMEDLLSVIDFLVDGEFIENRKSYDCYFAGSNNQRYIDIVKTLETGKIVTRNRFASIEDILVKSNKYRKI